MPDHFHMMWVGILDGSDQLSAMRHFRKRLNESLVMIEHRLQSQAYDNVLKDDERQEGAFHDACEYIARNPEQAGITPVDQFSEYRYSGCIVPGYPEFTPFQPGFWERFWRSYSYLQREGLIRVSESQ